MTDPGDVVAGIFSLVVILMVSFATYRALFGGNVAAITDAFSTLAFPLVILLIILFIALSIIQEV